MLIDAGLDEWATDPEDPFEDVAVEEDPEDLVGYGPPPVGSDQPLKWLMTTRPMKPET